MTAPYGGRHFRSKTSFRVGRQIKFLCDASKAVPITHPRSADINVLELWPILVVVRPHMARPRGGVSPTKQSSWTPWTEAPVRTRSLCRWLCLVTWAFINCNIQSVYISIITTKCNIICDSLSTLDIFPWIRDVDQSSKFTHHRYSHTQRFWKPWN